MQRKGLPVPRPSGPNNRRERRDALGDHGSLKSRSVRKCSSARTISGAQRTSCSSLSTACASFCDACFSSRCELPHGCRRSHFIAMGHRSPVRPIANEPRPIATCSRTGLFAEGSSGRLWRLRNATSRCVRAFQNGGEGPKRWDNPQVQYEEARGVEKVKTLLLELCRSPAAERSPSLAIRAPLARLSAGVMTGKHPRK